MNSEQDAQKASATISQLTFSILAGQTFGVGIRLGIADLVADDTKTPPQIAQQCDTHPEATQRLLRAWTALGLLDEVEADHFQLTTAGQLLRTDREPSATPTARLFTDPLVTDAWRRLDFSISTGTTAFDEVFGTDFFSYLAGQEELAQQFHAAMGQSTGRVADAIAAQYDFGKLRHVVDIGGGDGTLLAAILKAHPELYGTVFDSEDGAATAGDLLRANDLGDRAAVATGDFFSAVPDGGDLYVIKSVIHDWNDDQCATILDNVRQVIPHEGRLLIIEPVLPETVDGSMPPLIYLSDLNMLVNVGGKERTAADFELLCQQSGFDITEVTTTPETLGFSLIEATPV